MDERDNKDRLDVTMMNYCNKVHTEVVKTTFPNGCQLPFPHNKFLLMILAGAKGSKVNMSQILSCLGQQSLEGQRVTFWSFRLIQFSFIFAFSTILFFFTVHV